MARKIEGIAVVKLQIPAGKATPAPPVGSALGPHGVNIGLFTKEFNEKTAKDDGLIITAVIKINKKDRSFVLELKTPPVSVLIKKACNIKSGSKIPNKEKIASITNNQIEEIAKLKMKDLNTLSLESAIKMVKGSARSMGVTVKD